MSTKYLHRLDYRRYFSSVLVLVLFVCLVNVKHSVNTSFGDRTAGEKAMAETRDNFQNFHLESFNDSTVFLDNLRKIQLYNNAISAGIETTEDQMMARKALLGKVCSLMKNSTIVPPSPQVFHREYLKHLIVNKENQFLYCYLPKVANTNFRRVLLGLMGVVPKSEVPDVDGYTIYYKYERHFSYLKDVNAGNMADILQKYKKFIVVRDPLERLLSAYRNKIVVHPNPVERKKFYQKIAEFYGHYPQLNRAFANTDFLTFEDFLTYWTDVFDVKGYMNEHYTPYFLLCNPCDIDYDYIAKYRTLHRDVDYIFDKLKIDIEFPGRNDNYSNLDTGTLVEENYKNIPGSLLEKLWHVLKLDFLMFGYSLPDWFQEKINMS